MNTAQRTALAIGLAVVALMGVFPPWIEVFDGRASADIFLATPLAYAPVFAPPPKQEKNERVSRRMYVAIDLRRLVVQEGVAVAAIVGATLLLRDGRPSVQKEGRR